MFLKLCLIAIILYCSLINTVLSTGKGPIGIFNIDDRYVLVGDSAIDALLAVDLLQGGVVGHFILHNRKTDPEDEEALNAVGGEFRNNDGWRNPIDMSSCDKCKYIYMTTTKRASFYRIRLEMPLLEMARKGDFSSLARARLENYCPWEICSSDGTLRNVKVRMLEITRDGSKGFLAIYNGVPTKDGENVQGGIVKFSPLEDEKVSDASELRGGETFLAPKLLIESRPSGLTLTRDQKKLLVTLDHYMLIVDVEDGSYQRFNLEKRCAKMNNLRKGAKMSMHFRDGAIIDNNMYITGHENSITSNYGGNTGFSVYKLSYKDHDWIDCVVIAGDGKSVPGWVDGFGVNARFTRPHDWALLDNEDAVIMTDIDNRALRLVSLKPGNSFGFVSTISYDEQLWNSFYVGSRSKPEVLSKASGSFLTDKQSVKDAEDSNKLCQAHDDKRLCNIREIRALWSGVVADAKLSSAPFSSSDSLVVWTGESCHSCWLHHQGFCDKPSKKESAITRDGSSWGKDFQMVAYLADSGQIQTRCTHRVLPLQVAPLCCEDNLNQ